MALAVENIIINNNKYILLSLFFRAISILILSNARSRLTHDKTHSRAIEAFITHGLSDEHTDLFAHSEIDEAQQYRRKDG